MQVIIQIDPIVVRVVGHHTREPMQIQPIKPGPRLLVPIEVVGIGNVRLPFPTVRQQIEPSAHHETVGEVRVLSRGSEVEQLIDGEVSHIHFGDGNRLLVLVVEHDPQGVLVDRQVEIGVAEVEEVL